MDKSDDMSGRNKRLCAEGLGLIFFLGAIAGNCAQVKGLDGVVETVQASAIKADVEAQQSAYQPQQNSQYLGK